MESVEEVKRKNKGKENRYGNRYGFELKLRCVKLRLGEGLPVSLLSKELGVSKDVVYRWVKAYQERGEGGLRNQGVSSGSRRKLPAPVREKIFSGARFLPFLPDRRWPQPSTSGPPGQPSQSIFPPFLKTLITEPGRLRWHRPASHNGLFFRPARFAWHSGKPAGNWRWPVSLKEPPISSDD
jgi:transposase-like protein